MLTVTHTSFREVGRGLAVAGFFRGRPGPRSVNRVASIVFRSASMWGKASAADAFGKRIANSSPPYRKLRPPPPTRSSVAATMRSTWSPTSWP